jgi:hypothetical protein
VWQRICEEVKGSSPDQAAAFTQFKAFNEMLGQDFAGAFDAHVEFVDDEAFAGFTVAQLLDCLPSDAPHVLMLIADKAAMTAADHPLLVVDLIEKGRTFRAVPSQIQVIENNLSIANMDWEDFADYVDDDGVFRGVDE